MFSAKWQELKKYDPFIGTVVSDFMNKNDVRTIATGRYDLRDGCYVNVDEYDTRENHTFEAHRDYIDVQLMVDGEEEILYAPLSHGTEVIPYDSQKDIVFYTCDKGSYESVKLQSEMAVVLLPRDMHAPCNLIPKRHNRKLVFKIPQSLV